VECDNVPQADAREAFVFAERGAVGRVSAIHDSRKLRERVMVKSELDGQTNKTADEAPKSTILTL
jgi:hypothetical protein